MTKGQCEAVLNPPQRLRAASSVAEASDGQLLRALRRVSGRDGRGRIRGTGPPPRADGAARLPPGPRRPASGRGRVSGHLPDPGATGRLDPAAGTAGQLAPRGRLADGAGGEDAGRSQTAAGVPGLGLGAGRGRGDRQVGPARAGAGPPRDVRSPARGGLATAGAVSRSGRALRPRGADASGGGAPAPMPAEHHRRAADAGAGTAPGAADPARPGTDGRPPRGTPVRGGRRGPAVPSAGRFDGSRRHGDSRRAPPPRPASSRPRSSP